MKKSDVILALMFLGMVVYIAVIVAPRTPVGF